MDQATAIKLIEQHILSQRGSHWLASTSVLPAWKYAFYNPAKKNSEGSIVLKSDKTMLIVYVVLILFFSILFVLDDIYNLLYLSVAAVALVIIVRYSYYNTVMLFNTTGITFNSHTYYWKDYSGAFISLTSLHKKQEAHLILVDSAQRLTLLNITNIRKWNAIGTAVRDFQPPGWKQ